MDYWYTGELNLKRPPHFSIVNENEVINGGKVK
jgi:hypothetical protein